MNCIPESDAHTEEFRPCDTGTLEQLARKAVFGPKWSLADGPCWCDMKREESARKGTKIHSGHCKAMKALSSYLFGRLNSHCLDNATRPE